MVTTRRSLQSNRRQTRAQTACITKRTSKKKFDFQEHDAILESIRKNKSNSNRNKEVVAEIIQETNKANRPIRKATKAALQSIGKVINYERNITGDNEDRMDDSTFLSLPVLNVPDINDTTMMTHDSVNNNDVFVLEESIKTQYYPAPQQVHRSARHISSLSSIIRTVATDDLLTETDTDRSTIGNRNRNALQNRSTTTSTNQKRMYKSNAPTGRKTPSIVNVPTNECMNYNINDELTVDGNSNAQESVNTIKDLKDIIKHFGLSKYTSTNIPSRQDREYENNLDETDKRKYTQMVNISTGCINQVLKSICPGPSRRQLQRDISSRLSKNVGETADERKYRILFENMMEQMYCIMMNAKKVPLRNEF